MCQWAGVLAGSAGLELTLLLGCTAGRGVLRKGSYGCAVEGQVFFCFGCELFSSCFHNCFQRVVCLVLLGGGQFVQGFYPIGVLRQG